jgi:transcription-repair coupling factor (superfamily II helicase)
MTKSITLSKKHPLPHQVLIQQLVDLGYSRVPMVLEPGEMAVRGNIVDVYADTHSHPVRLEYFGDDVERMVSFEVTTQKSLSPLNKTVIGSAKRVAKHKSFISELEHADTSLISDIKAGDFVVHEDYGIGRYEGLKHLTFGTREGDYLFLRYKGEDKLYVPIEQVHLIHRYCGADMSPRINHLHDGSWNRIKTAAKRSLKELADTIYKTIKLRQKEDGFCFMEDTETQIELENDFGFKLTPDQATAIEAIKGDMESKKPMDRLICGDVGFGKTELILRASFKACENLKQVAVLVPTTVLAEQHAKTFRKRLGKYGYNVQAISRLKSPREQRQVLADLKSHKLDVIVGTHRLLQPSVKFKDLGLLVVDEEQRFGVTHKEKIKNLKVNLDILTTTATPIPRTLYMALTGARDFSILATPPPGRRPIRTTVAAYDKKVIKDAIQSELKRNGQVYYLYNRVETIDEKAAEIHRLIPSARIAIVHGQMNAHKMDDIMTEFYEQKIDILVCTTIIENGLDIANVNTVIIDRAEHLGLSQIHQIRGRVGRSDRQGFAYVLYTSDANLSENSKKRLQAIKEFVALGSGYNLAMKDLEIRGAGTLLGEKQSGNMTAIGFELYCKLLEETVDATKRRLNQSAPKPAQIHYQLTGGIKAYIPSSYVENPDERLALYKRIKNAQFQHQLDEITWDLEDRYGPAPKLVSVLLSVIRRQLK